MPYRGRLCPFNYARMYICTSALDMGFEKLVILNCHGRHAWPLNTASREISDAFNKGTALISPAALSCDEFDAVRKSAHGGAIHAGEWETSLVLQISPEVVDMSKATAEDAMRYHSESVAGTTSRQQDRNPRRSYRC